MQLPAEPHRGGVPSRLDRVLQLALLLALLAVNLQWARPYYNWDMLAYVAVALGFTGVSELAIHEETYRVVRETVPARNYERLTVGTGFLRATARDHEAFTQQLQHYSVKPAYPALIAVLIRAGMNPVRASVVLSRVGYVASAVIVFIWISSFLPAGASIASTWVIMSLPFTLDLARLSTPDALSTASVLTALWLFLTTDRYRTSLGILLLSIAIRPDNLLWLLAIAGCGALRLGEWRVSVAAVAAGALSYVAAAAWSGHLGWPTLFHHTFVEFLAYPEAFTPSLSPIGYVRVYLRESHPANLPPFLLLFLFTGALLFRGRLRQYGWTDRWVAVLVATGVSAGLHWLVFPEDDRILAAAYIMIMVLLVRTLAHRSAGGPMKAAGRGSGVAT